MNLLLFDPVTNLGAAPLQNAALTLFVKTSCVLLSAFAVSVAMRRAPAGARHLVWLVTLASLLALPALVAWAPVRIPVLPRFTSVPTVRERLATPPLAAAMQDGWPMEAGREPSHATERISGPAASAAARAAAGPGPSPVRTAPSRRRPIDVGLALIALWSLGAAALLGRLVLGAWAVRRIVRRARVLDQSDWQQPLYEIADRLGLEDAPRLLQSDRVTIPFACGFLRARIVLPRESETWSAERRAAVLVHELGHVRRRDLVGHAVSRIVCALYWFHPLVWSAARRLRAESERACDDLALALGTRPSDYAEHLLDIVTQVRDRGTPAVALAMANPREFEGRMLAILDPRIRRRGLGRAQTAWLAGSLAGAALLVGAVALVPRAVATQAPAPVPSASTGLVAVGPDRLESDSGGSAPTSDAARSQATDEAASRSARQDPDQASKDEAAGDARAEDADAEANGGQRVAVLAKTLRTDSSAEVRRVAAWGLQRFASDALAAQALAAAVAGDGDEEVREMAAWALSESRGGSAVAALEAALRRDKSPKVRRTAAWAVGSIGDPAAVPALVNLLADSDPGMREVAAWSIGKCSPQKAPAALVRLVSDADRDVRLSAAWALREIGDADAADELEAAFHREQDPEVQQGFIRALGAMGDRAIDTLTRLVDSKDPEVRAVAVAALAGGNVTGPWPWPRPEPRPFP